jgi:hypothetical protein
MMTADCLRLLTTVHSDTASDILNECDCLEKVVIDKNSRLATIYLFSAILHSRLSQNRSLPSDTRYHTLKGVVHQVVQVEIHPGDKSEEIVTSCITALAALAGADMFSVLAELICIEANEIATFHPNKMINVAMTFALCTCSLLRFSLAHLVSRY